MRENMDNIINDEFLEYWEKIDKEGKDELLQYLINRGYFDAPASTRYHMAEPGGLVEHSLNVCRVALEVNETLGKPCSESSVVFVALLHDLGKAGFNKRDYYEPQYKINGELKATPYARNKDVVPLPHEITGALTLERFVKVTDEEVWALIHHNGMYGDLKYNLQGKESELQMIIHFADMWASRVLEG